jgi:predicted permease
VYRQGWRNHAPGISPGLARFLESRRIVLAPGDKGVRSIGAQFETPLVILMSVVSVVLLIACANVANLLLARAAARRREMAIRLALGAARRRLVRQLLIEGLLLSAAGGTLGLLLAIWSARGLVNVLPRAVLDVGPDARVLGFTILVSVLTTVVFGIVPALRATRPDITPVWKGPLADAWGSRARLGRLLASGQVAMSLLLLIAAGLFIRTLGNLRGLDAGFHGEHVLLASMNPNLSRYSSERTDVFYADLVDRVSALPGVQAATIADAPLLGSAYVDGFSVEPSTESAETSLRVVAPRFFETMSIAIRQGRDFTGGDDSRSPKVAIINETIARKFFAGTNPVGRRIGVAGSSGVEIVGVIADTRYRGLRQAVPNIVYLPIAQVPRGADRTVHIRTAGPPASIADAVRAQVRALDATLPVRIRPFTDLVDEDLAQERLIASLSGFFGVLALALTSIGLYGVIAYGVQRRTREIGIRMALGARRSTVLGMVLRDCLGVVAAGIAIGIPASLWLTRLVTRQLFGVEPADPSTIATMTLSIAGVAFLAAVVPARRASRVDPSTALRTE